MDLASKAAAGDPPSLTCEHEDCTENCFEWLNYPQSLFPNWTSQQVGRSAMLVKAGQQSHCHMYYLDVGDDGRFADTREIEVKEGDEIKLWDVLQVKVNQFVASEAVKLYNSFPSDLQICASGLSSSKI
jgi:hypothetical protein